ncbi:hypothetical protein Tco_0173052 [Tanacetum coccineum]
MIENKKLDEDLQGKQVDATLYCGVIRSLMYLTSSRPDLNHVVYLCARTINMGLWYLKDTDMSFTAYVDADHAVCQYTRRSTSGSAQFLGDKLVSWSSKKQKSTAISNIFKICPRVHGQDFDALPTDEEIVSFLRELGHSGEINSLNDVIVDQMHQPWITFAALINRSLSGKTIGLDKLRLSRAQILWQKKIYYPRFTKVIIHYFLTQDKTVSRRNKIGMHTSKDDYLINTLKFVSTKEATQIYGAIIPESLTSPEMKESKTYKTYLGFATGATPPKIERKFKKASPSKKDLNLNQVPVDKEPKSAKKKVPAKKTTRKQTSGVVIRDTPVESSSKRKEKFEEVRKKSLRDFHKTYPSGSGAVKIKPSIISEGTGAKPGVPDVTEEESSEKSDSSDEEYDSDDENTQSNNENGSDSEHETDENESGSEYDHQENEEEVEDDEEEKEDEYVRTPSYYSPTDDEDKTNVDDNAEGDEDEEMDYTTSQLYDDVDIRLNKPVQADDEMVQKEGTDAELTNIQQGDENLEITPDQVIDDAHMTISTIDKKTEVPVTSSSHSSDLAAKFLNFADIPTTEAEIVSPMDVPVHHEVPSGQTPTLLVVPISIITESSPKTEVPVTSFSHSSDLAAKILNFSDIPHTDAEIIFPMDVHVHHEVPRKQTPTLLTIHISVITDTSAVCSTVIPQSLQSFTPPPLPSTPTPPPTTKAKNPQYALPDFASVFQFNNRVSALEKDVFELKSTILLKLK